MRGTALSVNALLALLLLIGWAMELRGQSLTLSPDLWLRAAYTFQVTATIWALMRPAARSMRVLALCANASLGALNLWLLFRFALGGEPAPAPALAMLLGMGLVPAVVNLLALGLRGTRPRSTDPLTAVTHS